MFSFIFYGTELVPVASTGKDPLLIQTLNNFHCRFLSVYTSHCKISSSASSKNSVPFIPTFFFSHFSLRPFCNHALGYCCSCGAEHRSANRDLFHIAMINIHLFWITRHSFLHAFYEAACLHTCMPACLLVCLLPIHSPPAPVQSERNARPWTWRRHLVKSQLTTLGRSLSSLSLISTSLLMLIFFFSSRWMQSNQDATMYHLYSSAWPVRFM